MMRIFAIIVVIVATILLYLPLLEVLLYFLQLDLVFCILKHGQIIGQQKRV